MQVSFTVKFLAGNQPRTKNEEIILEPNEMNLYVTNILVKGNYSILVIIVNHHKKMQINSLTICV